MRGDICGTDKRVGNLRAVIDDSYLHVYLMAKCLQC